jgi:hypothetical protein
MTKVKTFQADNMADMENTINEWLKNHIGISVSMTDNGTYYVAIVLYKD